MCKCAVAHAKKKAVTCSKKMKCQLCEGGRFVDRGVTSEFEKNDFQSTGNLTDFRTKITWSDTKIRNDAYALLPPRHATPAKTRPIKPIAIYCPPVTPYCSLTSAPRAKEWARARPIIKSKNAAGFKGNFTIDRILAADRCYSCDRCGKTFTRNEELTRHKKIHSGERPHECPQCHKRFGRKDHLTKHRKTHQKASERRNYQCDQCNNRYTRSDALTRHKRTNHKLN